MPRRTLSITGLADRDLQTIRRHSIRVWDYRQTRSYIESIFSVAESLCQFPELGKMAGPQLPGVRIVRSGRHNIFYRVLEAEIEILRVLHERMDAPEELG